MKGINIMRILKRMKFCCPNKSRKKIQLLCIKISIFHLRQLRNSPLCTSQVFCVILSILDRRLNKVKQMTCINNQQMHCNYIDIILLYYRHQHVSASLPAMFRMMFLVIRIQLQLYGCISLHCIKKLIVSVQNLQPDSIVKFTNR